MNSTRLREILSSVTYPGYTWRTSGPTAERMYLQASFLAPCALTGSKEVQFTRKWYISREATPSEVVQTALKCVLTSVEHEAREQFKYRGRAVFGPRLDVDTLWRLSGPEGIARREPQVDVEAAHG